jgi:hypothetical protein
MSDAAEATNISEAQLRAEAPQARRLLDNEYFQTITREMQLAAMEQAIVAPTDTLRNEARVEALMIRKMIGYLTVIANGVKDMEQARQNLKAHE